MSYCFHFTLGFPDFYQTILILYRILGFCLESILFQSSISISNLFQSYVYYLSRPSHRPDHVWSPIAKCKQNGFKFKEIFSLVTFMSFCEKSCFLLKSLTLLCTARYAMFQFHARENKKKKAKTYIRKPVNGAMGHG